MSVRRLVAIKTVPARVKRIFNNAPEPVTSEESLWRERAARMTLDALGHTNLTMKPMRHNEVVKYARRWFRGFFDCHPDPKHVDISSATFDAGGLVDFQRVRIEVLDITPYLFPERGHNA